MSIIEHHLLPVFACLQNIQTSQHACSFRIFRLIYPSRACLNLGYCDTITRCPSPGPTIAPRLRLMQPVNSEQRHRHRLSSTYLANLVHLVSGLTYQPTTSQRSIIPAETRLRRLTSNSHHSRGTTLHDCSSCPPHHAQAHSDTAYSILHINRLHSAVGSSLRLSLPPSKLDPITRKSTFHKPTRKPSNASLNTHPNPRHLLPRTLHPYRLRRPNRVRALPNRCVLSPPHTSASHRITHYTHR